MPAINVQIIQESKILFAWKVVLVQADITIEQFFLELIEKYILSEHLDLVEQVEVKCGNSKTSINQSIDLVCNLWEIAIEYGKHFVFQFRSQITSSNYQRTNPFDIMLNMQNSITLPVWKPSVKPNKKGQLRNDIKTWIGNENGGWIGPDTAETIGKPFIQDLINALWYIDGCNYNTFTQRHKLNEHSECLLKHVTRSWISRLPFSRFLKEPVTKLGEDLSKYAEYLAQKHVEMLYNREFDQPIVNECDSGQIKILAANIKCTLEETIKYKNLSSALQANQYWQPILVDDFCSSMSRMQKHRYLTNLEVRFVFKIGTYTYHHGNVCNMTYAWRIDEELINNASAAETTDQNDVDERVKLAFELNDPEVISDLRELNEGRPSRYDEFWAVAKQFLEGIAQEAVVAVDERRHDPIVHLAQAISVRDLRNMLEKEAKKSIHKYQFLQVRQLRGEHIDLHYASALFRYLKEMAIMFRDEAWLVFMDDKHRCKVGEPGHPVAAVERGK
ncbi:hypothetical protein C2G38_2182522 [Gigaspora rosea]|uniref:Uncharacterized protein n=1 Tax=Gigaspora rosea TaxID=44941 RepID=A0A397VAZ4_9GLOM|nr:hypothetical protein C2G38_2182522 [Gigaspora rosea]